MVIKIVYVAAIALGSVLSATSPAVLAPEQEASRVSSRIVSGWAAQEGQFPYALLLRATGLLGALRPCGGAIVSRRWGLTTGHCVALSVTVVVRAGSIYADRPTVLIDTHAYYTHPLYIDALPNLAQTNDIALIDLLTPLVWSPTVLPIRVQRRGDRDRNYAGAQLVAAGWGQTWTGGALSNVLNWVTLAGVSNVNCLAQYGGSLLVGNTVVCAGPYDNPTQGICQADNGGPLVVADVDGFATLIGVAAFFPDNGCHNGLASGFTRTGWYHDWYQFVTGEDLDWDLAPEGSGEQDFEDLHYEENTDDQEYIFLN